MQIRYIHTYNIFHESTPGLASLFTIRAGHLNPKLLFFLSFFSPSHTSTEWNIEYVGVIVKTWKVFINWQACTHFFNPRLSQIPHFGNDISINYAWINFRLTVWASKLYACLFLAPLDAEKYECILFGSSSSSPSPIHWRSSVQDICHGFSTQAIDSSPPSPKLLGARLWSSDSAHVTSAEFTVINLCRKVQVGGSNWGDSPG